MTKLTKQQSIHVLLSAIQGIATVERGRANSVEFKLWQRDTERTLIDVFNPESHFISDFRDIGYVQHSRDPLASALLPADAQDALAQNAYSRGLKQACDLLLRATSEINQHSPDDARSALPAMDKNNEGAAWPVQGPAILKNRDVFIVHGHDPGLKHTVARFLEKLELTAIVLHEQPDRGRTIIEKFKDHAPVPFAVALFTGDDLGGTARDIKALPDLKPRARQNVVFEFGYFVGSMPQGHCVALVEKGVELPSDWDGVLHIRVDEAGGWQNQLVKELKAAGLNVDANKVL